MNPEQQKSELQKVEAIVLGFPKYLFHWVIGTLVSLMTDPTATMLGIGAIFLGFAVHSVLWAFVAFLVIMAVLRTVNSIANSIGYGLQGLGFSMKQMAPPMPSAPPIGHPLGPPEAHPLAPSPAPLVSPTQGERINVVAPPASAPGSAFPGD